MWTRTLKTRTGMHQAVVNRVIKNLEQRKLIKNVKSVKARYYRTDAALSHLLTYP